MQTASYSLVIASDGDLKGLAVKTAVGCRVSIVELQKPGHRLVNSDLTYSL